MSKPRPFKRGIALGDFHCGHLAGLTHPDWHGAAGQFGEKVEALVAESWQWFAGKVDALRPFDFALVNADLIDGPGDKSGGLELLTRDRNKQVEMAVKVVEYLKAPRHLFTYGTPYHTGTAEDWEYQIARRFGAKIGDHEWATIHGVTFDLKHHIGGSQVPHGRHTAIARDRLWNQLWAEREEQPKASVILRSHVHYHAIAGGPGWIAMTLPALQSARTKFGGRRCSGTVDYGFATFDVYPSGNLTWQVHLAQLQSQKAHALKL